MTITTRNRLRQRECWALLRTPEVGRLCYTESAMPVIRAVPFVVDGASVVVALRPSAARPDVFVDATIVAFEAGEWPYGQRAGWSVHFVGKAQAVPAHEVADIVDLGLTPWIDGEPALYVRVRTEVLVGIQVGEHVVSADLRSRTA